MYAYIVSFIYSCHKNPEIFLKCNFVCRIQGLNVQRMLIIKLLLPHYRPIGQYQMYMIHIF